MKELIGRRRPPFFRGRPGAPDTSRSRPPTPRPRRRAGVAAAPGLPRTAAPGVRCGRAPLLRTKRPDPARHGGGLAGVLFAMLRDRCLLHAPTGATGCGCGPPRGFGPPAEADRGRPEAAGRSRARTARYTSRPASRRRGVPVDRCPERRVCGTTRPGSVVRGFFSRCDSTSATVTRERELDRALTVVHARAPLRPTPLFLDHTHLSRPRRPPCRAAPSPRQPGCGMGGRLFCRAVGRC